MDIKKVNSSIKKSKVVPIKLNAKVKFIYKNKVKNETKDFITKDVEQKSKK